MAAPNRILDLAFKRASSHLGEKVVNDPEVASMVEFVCRNLSNRACVRWLLASLLAKAHKPKLDIRKPYTEIGSRDSYSGRTYDEAYIEPFILKHGMPCNPTTAFLTPALRNRNTTLKPNMDLEGRPKEVYRRTLLLLADVQKGKVSAKDLLTETIRCLLVYGSEKQERMKSLLAGLEAASRGGRVPLSAEGIMTLIEQHLSCRGASRLPVLVVAAAYRAAAKHLGERVLPLRAHTAADKQTGAIGDLEITLVDDEQVVTSYEMKSKRVTRGDIDFALQKVKDSGSEVDNYIFITTDVIEKDVKEYAASMYDNTGGIEFVVLDCIGFLRHFLHLFHRLRTQFLEAYQELVLQEPESAVRQELKEAFLALRQAAESGEI